MANVDNQTLAYSFYESLSEFICNYSDEIAKEIKAKDIVFMWKCLQILFCCQKHLKL